MSVFKDVLYSLVALVSLCFMPSPFDHIKICRTQRVLHCTSQPTISLTVEPTYKTYYIIAVKCSWIFFFTLNNKTIWHFHNEYLFHHLSLWSYLEYMITLLLESVRSFFLNESCNTHLKGCFLLIEHPGVQPLKDLLTPCLSYSPPTILI